MSEIKKIALVLSGGGFKGSFQLGVLNYLSAHWEKFFPAIPHMHFDIIAGVSAGSLNGVMLASQKLTELNYIWKRVGLHGTGEIFQNNYLTENKNAEDQLTVDLQAVKQKFFPNFTTDIGYMKGFELLSSKSRREKYLYHMGMQLYEEFKKNFNQVQGLVSNLPLAKKLKMHVDKDELYSDFICGFVSLDTGQYISAHQSEFDSNDDFINGILASTSIPIVFPPIKSIHINGKKYSNLVDGGLLNVSPIGDVINFIHKKGGDPKDYVLLVINLGTTKVQEISYDEADILRIALRTMNEISSAHNFNKDLQTLLRINDLVRQISSTDNPVIYNYNLAQKRRTTEVMSYFKNIIIQPDLGCLGGTLQVNTQLNNDRYAHGRTKAKQALSLMNNRLDDNYLSVIV